MKTLIFYFYWLAGFLRLLAMLSLYGLITTLELPRYFYRR